MGLHALQRCKLGANSADIVSCEYVQHSTEQGRGASPFVQPGDAEEVAVSSQLSRTRHRGFSDYHELACG